MKKVAVIYWSGTGNTEEMAAAVADGAKEGGAAVELLPVSRASLQHVAEADAVALGCPSMGNEVLEESEMEPFVASLESANLSGKPMALFGSYGWGNGEWMQDWESRMKAMGAQLVADGLIINGQPDQEGLASCKELGSKLAG